VSAPLAAELRCWPELATLLTGSRFRAPARAERRPAVLLIPGFMAGDASLAVLAGWLRRRGHSVRSSGMWLNADCAGRELTRLERRLARFDQPVVVIGQSRGGTLARALAAGHPSAVAAVVTLGSPVLDPLAVSPSVLRTIRSVARLGDLGVHGVFSSGCRDGECCASFHSLLRAPLGAGTVALAVYSRTDAIVDWRACLDPHAECVEVDGSHCGMSVNAGVYRELERVLDHAEVAACSR
jgi:pimeloyl-ACP methyl ester carboxylesterase